MNKEDKIKLFANELNWIKNPSKREFARVMLENAPEYFFHVSASSSGKYHPQFDLGEGGLVRHTRCVAYFAKSLACTHQLNDEFTDDAIIAALAHDIKKQGNGNGGHTVTEHPLLAAEYVESLRTTVPDAFDDEEFSMLIDGIKSHMGQWGAKDGLPTPKSWFQYIIHDADYIASRKEILDFKFDPIDDEQHSVNEIKTYQQSAPSIEPKDYVLQFGKHRGKTLAEAESTGYLDWMVKQEDFFNKEAQEMAKRYLSSKNNSTKTFVSPEPAPAITAEDIDDLPF
jgi:hypothetical protein